ncbi:MAG TPA: general stress protein [Chthonomonadaceae bacterium]|nr:general stress protein [Chthonomonadaceae bacterium]
MANLITGLFDTEAAAEQAVVALRQIGYTQNEISIIMRDRRAAQELADETGSRTMEGFGTGALWGGAFGAVIAALVAGPAGWLVFGPLATVLAGVGAGGIVGGIIGGLVDAGLPPDVMPYYERGLNEGGVVVAVACHPGDEARVQRILQGGSVAWGGYNTPSYVTPGYASRYTDLTPPPNVYTATTTTPVNPPAPPNATIPPSTESPVYSGTTEMNPPPRVYDSEQSYATATNVPQADQTANTINADQRADLRDAAEHERESRRDEQVTGPLSGAATTAENAWDRTQTAATNTADKAATGAENEADRLA